MRVETARPDRVSFGGQGPPLRGGCQAPEEEVGVLRTITLWACLLCVSVSFASGSHKVRAGENDVVIARKHGITVAQLHQANPGVRWTRLQIGQSLKLPGRDRTPSRSARNTRATAQANHTHVVRSGESNWTIARQYSMSVAQLESLNPNVDFHPLQVGTRVRVIRPQQTVARNTPRPAQTRPAPSQPAAARPAASRPQATVAVATRANAPASATTRPATSNTGGITTANAEVTGNDVSVRSAPTTSAGRVRTVDRGTVARIVDRQNDWYRVAFANGQTGWISARFLKGTERALTPLAAPQTAPTRVASTSQPTKTVTDSGRALINTATSLMGIRYRWGGTSRNGFDCSGFVQYVFRQHGVRLPRTSTEQSRVGNSVPRNQLRTGDLVFFITRGRRISHVGIYIGNNRFIHASSGGNRIRVNELEGYYSRTYAGARRVSTRFVTSSVQEDLDALASTLPVEDIPEGVDPEPAPVVATNRGADITAP